MTLQARTQNLPISGTDVVPINTIFLIGLLQRFLIEQNTSRRSARKGRRKGEETEVLNFK
jgi:hypothetical protein